MFKIVFIFFLLFNVSTLYAVTIFADHSVTFTDNPSDIKEIKLSKAGTLNENSLFCFNQHGRAIGRFTYEMKGNDSNSDNPDWHDHDYYTGKWLEGARGTYRCAFILSLHESISKLSHIEYSELNTKRFHYSKINKEINKGEYKFNPINFDFKHDKKKYSIKLNKNSIELISNNKNLITTNILEPAYFETLEIKLAADINKDGKPDLILELTGDSKVSSTIILMSNGEKHEIVKLWYSGC